MDPATARDIATRNHADQRTRTGGLVVDHLVRVATAVPPEAGATAWLHDVLERTDVTADALRVQGLSETELDALALLTRAPGESYELHALRIAHARGEPGRLARIVKVADLDDHLRRAPQDGDPPYAWARRHIAGRTEPARVVTLRPGRAA